MALDKLARLENHTLGRRRSLLSILLETLGVLLVSALLTAGHFYEYFGRRTTVHIPFDLSGYHYPLLSAAFLSFKSGHFPFWDASIYCGIPFAGNIQAAVFYPMTWIALFLYRGKENLPYEAAQLLAVSHFAIAASLCYLWLRAGLKLRPVACAIGALIYAFSGYLSTQINHLGLVSCYTWLPLAWFGVDGYNETGDWRRLWKTALSVCLSLLAGYPATWVAIVLCILAYSACSRLRWKSLWATALFTAAGVATAAVQVVLAVPASSLKVVDLKYGAQTGIREFAFYISYFFPNYYDFALTTDVGANPGKDYLYLGGAGIVGIAAALLFCRELGTRLLPLLAALAVSLAFVVNPGGLIGAIVQESTLLAQVVTDWYFLAGITASAAGLAALGFHAILNRPPARNTHAGWVWALVAVSAAIAWIHHLWRIWLNTPNAIPKGPDSIADACAASAICAALAVGMRFNTGAIRFVLSAVCLIFIATEFKIFGTSKRFNAEPGPIASRNPQDPLPGADFEIYTRMRADRAYRIALDHQGINATGFRHVGLRTPQGFDPMLPARYHQFVSQFGVFETNRLFSLKAEDPQSLRTLGVKYFMVAEESPEYKSLVSNPSYRQANKNDEYFKIFELIDAQPEYSWRDRPQDRSIDLLQWRPDLRELKTHSAQGGMLRLSEQYYPGWKATVDGAEVRIENCDTALQCITVPAGGEHMVAFRFRPPYFLPGALVSALMLAWICFLGVRHQLAPLLFG